MRPLFGNQTFRLNENVQTQYMTFLLNAVKNFVNAQDNNRYLFIDHLMIPVIRSVFAVEESAVPEHEELVDICRKFLIKHRVTVSTQTKIGEHYAVSLIPKKPIEKWVKGNETIDASWTINHESIGEHVAKIKDKRLIYGFINRYAPYQVGTEDQEENNEKYHVLWIDGSTSKLYGEEEYFDARDLFNESLERCRKFCRIFSKSRIYVEEYGICFNSNWFDTGKDFYDYPMCGNVQAVDTFIVLGFIKFLHELFHTFTDFILDMEWFYKQRATSTVIQRYPATPPRIGVRLVKSKYLIGDLGNAMEEILFGNHRRLKVVLKGVDEIQRYVFVFQKGEVKKFIENQTSVSSGTRFRRFGQSSSSKQQSPATKIPKEKTVTKIHTRSQSKRNNQELEATKRKEESEGNTIETATIAKEQFITARNMWNYQTNIKNHIRRIYSHCSAEDFRTLLQCLQVADELLEPMPDNKTIHRRLSEKDKSRKFAEGMKMMDLYAEDCPTIGYWFQNYSIIFNESCATRSPVDSH